MLCISCLFLFTSPSLPLVFLSLPGKLSVSPRRMHETRCRHIVFIAPRSLPAGPRPRCDWLGQSRTSQLNMQLFTILLIFPSGNESVTAKRIWARTYGQIIHPRTHMQAGTRTHALTSSRKNSNVFINASVFSVSPSSSQVHSSEEGTTKICVTGLDVII